MPVEASTGPAPPSERVVGGSTALLARQARNFRAAKHRASSCGFLRMALQDESCIRFIKPCKSLKASLHRSVIASADASQTFKSPLLLASLATSVKRRSKPVEELLGLPACTHTLTEARPCTHSILAALVDVKGGQGASSVTAKFTYDRHVFVRVYRGV